MNESEWLASLKPWDTIAVSGGLGGREMWLAKVHRKTKSGRIIILSHGQETAYNPDGGERGGDEYYRSQLYEPTQAIRDQIEKARLTAKMRLTSWHKLPLETLRKMEELIRCQ